MTFKLTECYIRVTVLKYLDLALDAGSWVSLHNSLAFTQILFYNCKEFLWWLFQLQTDFQLTTLNGCGRFLMCKFNHVILTPVGFCVISPWSFSRFLSNHKKALLQWLLHLHAKFRPIPSSGLFYVFLSIYSQCDATASWTARHTTVCLDFWLNVSLIIMTKFCFYIW